MNDPVLTAEGRELLAQRLDTLREDVLPPLRVAATDRDGAGEAVAEHERVIAEMSRLEHLLACAAALEEEPDDPAVVELGDLVTLETDTGDIERFLIVDPAEAALDGLRVSATAPLASALLTHRVGEQVTVHGPGGSYGCRILGAVRPVASSQEETSA